MNKGAKAVGEAITGLDFATVVVNGKAYTIFPPTVNRIAGAAKCLSSVHEGDTWRNVILSLGDYGQYAKALSWFIQGDESLAGELGNGTDRELVEALEVSMSMIGIEVFRKAVSLARSVGLLTARPR